MIKPADLPIPLLMGLLTVWAPLILFKKPPSHKMLTESPQLGHTCSSYMTLFLTNCTAKKPSRLPTSMVSKSLGGLGVDFSGKVLYSRYVNSHVTVITIIGDTMATLTNKTTRSRRKTVNFDELRELIARRRRSSYPTDARTERQYWLRQISSLMGETD